MIYGRIKSSISFLIWLAVAQNNMAAVHVWELLDMEKKSVSQYIWSCTSGKISKLYIAQLLVFLNVIIYTEQAIFCY